MNQKDLRRMLAQTLDMVGKVLPTTNEALSLAHAIFLATNSQDPGRGLLIQSHFERLQKTSNESIAQVLNAVVMFESQLNDDSLWTD